MAIKFDKYSNTTIAICYQIIRFLKLLKIDFSIF